MTKLNNKGQVLVLFIILLPIIIFILFIVVDIGNTYLKKQELCSITRDAITYLKDGKEEKQVLDLIKENNPNIKSTIQDNTITSTLEVKGVIKMYDLNIFEVNCSYKIENNKIRRITNE